MEPDLPRCPKCGSSDIRVSKDRNFLDMIMRTIFRMRAYRCRSCRKRFFAPIGLLDDRPAHS